MEHTKNKKQIVKESNVIARARIMPPSSTVWDERVIAAIAARNTINDTEFHEQKLDVRKELGEKTLSTRQYNEAKNAIKLLSHKTFELSLGERGVRAYPIFAVIEIDDDGVVTGKINHELHSYYLEIQEQFALRSLPDFQKLTSTYSQKLYRFLNSWKNIPGGEKIISLHELHEILQTPESFQKDFRSFRTRVLEVARKEINAVAEKSANVKRKLAFEWEPVKENPASKTSKVKAVKFIFNEYRKAAEPTSIVALGNNDISSLTKQLTVKPELTQEAFEELRREGKKALDCWMKSHANTMPEVSAPVEATSEGA